MGLRSEVVVVLVPLFPAPLAPEGQDAIFHRDVHVLLRVDAGQLGPDHQVVCPGEDLHRGDEPGVPVEGAAGRPPVPQEPAHHVVRLALGTQHLVEKLICLQSVERLRQTLWKSLDSTRAQFRFTQVVMIEVMGFAGIELPIHTVQSSRNHSGCRQVRIGARINQPDFQSAVRYAHHTASIVVAIRYIGRSPGRS